MSKIDLSPRALLQLKAAEEWWQENRSMAPDLFLNEVDNALLRLAEHPCIGSPYPRPLHPNIRRVILKRTGYHIYYEYDESSDRIWIMDVWSAFRGEDPPL